MAPYLCIFTFSFNSKYRRDRDYLDSMDWGQVTLELTNEIKRLSLSMIKPGSSSRTFETCKVLTLSFINCRYNAYIIVESIFFCGKILSAVGHLGAFSAVGALQIRRIDTRRSILWLAALFIDLSHDVY